MKIMIVDDARAVHAFIKGLFSDTEHELLHAYNGLEAVKLIESEHLPDLILLDWEMPIKDGLETLGEIRKNGCQIPIVMVTSRNDVNYIISALETGANEYVMKPFTRDVLFDKLAIVMGEEI